MKKNTNRQARRKAARDKRNTAMQEFLARRDAAIKSQDVETWKAFCKDCQAKGIYDIPLPPDAVIEVSLRKMLYHIKSATAQEKQTARKWLFDRGYDTDID